jgi:cytochrome c oxidase subunit 3
MAYLIYRVWYPEAWSEGSQELNIILGGFNTVVLIGSSLTLALAVRAAQTGCGKGNDRLPDSHDDAGGSRSGREGYSSTRRKFETGHVTGPKLPFRRAVRAAGGDLLLAYFALTGLHALHMIIGFGILSVILWMAWRNKFSPQWYTPVELSGLYWHFV